MLIKIRPTLVPTYKKRFPSHLCISMDGFARQYIQARYGNIIANKDKLIMGFHETLFGDTDFASDWYPLLTLMNRDNHEATRLFTFTKKTLANRIKRITQKLVEEKGLKITPIEMAYTSMPSDTIFRNVWHVFDSEQIFNDDIERYLNGITNDGELIPKNIYYINMNDYGLFPFIISFGQIAFITPGIFINEIYRLIDSIFRASLNFNFLSDNDGARNNLKVALHHEFFNRFIAWDTEEVIKKRAKDYIANNVKQYDKISVSVGADPEIEFYNPKVLKNGKIIPDFKQGIVDASTVLRDGNYDANVGLDGCSRIAEIRPSPSTDTTTVAKNIKKCMQSLSKKVIKSGKNVVPIVGGGFLWSCGGHIHLGHEILKGLPNNQNTIKKLLHMLDTFLYYPLKLNNPFATRSWSKHPEINKEYDTQNPRPDIIPNRIITESEDVVSKLITKQDPIRDMFSCYDLPSACRDQNWGIEYRSLPSFICDYQLTRIVLKIAQKITEKFLTTCVEKTSISYHEPPISEDYEQFITKQEYLTFMRYINGDRKHLMVDNAFRNWKIKTKSILMGLVMEVINHPDFNNVSYLNKIFTDLRETSVFKNYSQNVTKEVTPEKFTFNMIRAHAGDDEQHHFVSTILNGTYLFSNSTDLSYIRKIIRENFIINGFSINTFISIRNECCTCNDCYTSELRRMNDGNIFNIGLSQAIYLHKIKCGIISMPGELPGTLYSILNISENRVNDLRNTDTDALDRLRILTS